MNKKDNDDDYALSTQVDLPELLEFAYQKGTFSVVPSKEGTTRGRALLATKGQTQIQLDMLLEQMRLIAQQARDIKARVALSQKIYRAQMNFEPDVGNRYHLYLKQDGSTILSLISPAEWGQGPKQQSWLAEVELAADHTWKVINSSESFTAWMSN